MADMGCWRYFRGHSKSIGSRAVEPNYNEEDTGSVGPAATGPAPWCSPLSAASSRSKEQGTGSASPTILNLRVWAQSYEEIDIFDWQSISQDMLSVSELEVALAAAEGHLRSKVLNGDLTPDHTLEIGTRRHFYFRKDRKAEIAKRFGLEPVTAANVRERLRRMVLEHVGPYFRRVGATR